MAEGEQTLGWDGAAKRVPGTPVYRQLRWMVGRCWWLGCRRPVSLQPCAGCKRVDGIASAEGQPVCQNGY